MEWPPHKNTPGHPYTQYRNFLKRRPDFTTKKLRAKGKIAYYSNPLGMGRTKRYGRGGDLQGKTALDSHPPPLVGGD
jgi:hypothetical protein